MIFHLWFYENKYEFYDKCFSKKIMETCSLSSQAKQVFQQKGSVDLQP